jgi:hypothetical protein
MVIKHAEETTDCTTAQHFYVRTECIAVHKTERTINKGSKYNPISFCRPKKNNSNASDEKYLVLVLQKCKNGILITRQKIEMKAVEDLQP